MTESSAAVMLKDVIKDCMQEAEPVHPGGDTSYGSMLIEGHCGEFKDISLPFKGTAGFRFVQNGFVYLVNVLAERTPSRDAAPASPYIQRR